MPLWRIFSTPSTFTDDQKSALAAAITVFYTPLLPAFYVNVLFVELDPACIFVGGERRRDFVRIAIEHIARHQPRVEDDAEGRRARLVRAIDALLEPHIAARGTLQWEWHVSETPRDLWRIQGLEPPPSYSEEERVWARENRALPWKDGELRGSSASRL